MRHSILNHTGGVISLLLNLIFILIFVGLLVWKWDYVRNKFDNSCNHKNPSDETLLAFNNNPLEVVNDSFNINANSTVSMVILGNSITMCDVPQELPDKTPRGMTATSPEKDYVHRLVKMFAQKNNVNIQYSVCNIANFERGFTKIKFNFDSLFANISISAPDYLIVQIGENVSSEDIAHSTLFKQEYGRLLSSIDAAHRVITLPFWPDSRKQDIITEIAIENGARLSDISHLGAGTEPSNFAKAQQHYSIPGVGEHPSDTAMYRIAQVLLCNLTR